MKLNLTKRNVTKSNSKQNEIQRNETRCITELFKNGHMGKNLWPGQLLSDTDISEGGRVG